MGSRLSSNQGGKDGWEAEFRLIGRRLDGLEAEFRLIGRGLDGLVDDFRLIERGLDGWQADFRLIRGGIDGWEADFLLIKGKKTIRITMQMVLSLADEKIAITRQNLPLSDA